MLISARGRQSVQPPHASWWRVVGLAAAALTVGAPQWPSTGSRAVAGNPGA